MVTLWVTSAVRVSAQASSRPLKGSIEAQTVARSDQLLIRSGSLAGLGGLSGVGDRAWIRTRLRSCPALTLCIVAVDHRKGRLVKEHEDLGVDPASLAFPLYGLFVCLPVHWRGMLNHNELLASCWSLRFLGQVESLAGCFVDRGHRVADDRREIPPLDLPGDLADVQQGLLELAQLKTTRRSI